jgi:hypothetical protein
VGKTSVFVRNTILAIAFSLSLGFTWARADDNPDDNSSILDRPDYNSDYHQYQLAPSHWSIGFRGAISAFPFSSFAGSSYQLYVDWILPFQKSGLFSVGLHYGTFPINSSVTNAYGNTIPYPNYLSQMGGFQFRYQLRYWKNQLIVPIVGVDVDYYDLVIGGGIEDRATGLLVSPDFGVMLSLGVIDDVTARDAYQTIGMTRTYLTLEAQPFSLSATNVSFSGTLFYMGLRFEFE